jgi:hypothetical protein
MRHQRERISHFPDSVHPDSETNASSKALADRGRVFRPMRYQEKTFAV